MNLTADQKIALMNLARSLSKNTAETIENYKALLLEIKNG